MGRAYGLRRPRYSCTCAPRALSFRVTPFSASRLALLRAKRSRDEIASICDSPFRLERIVR